MALLLRILRWTLRDAVAFVVGTVVVMVILVNVLFMQPGSPPTPLFKPAEVEDAAQRAAKRAQSAPNGDAPSAALTPKPVTPHPPRTPGEIITDVQRELARRGYYDGPVDGLYGPRTDSAIREFERAADGKPSAQPSEVLLQLIKGIPVRSGKRVAESTTGSAESTFRATPPVQPPAVPARVITVQRALTEYGYGQIRPNGTLDPDTQRAIILFERQRNLPITGKLSERLIRELSSVTGHTLE